MLCHHSAHLATGLRLCGLDHYSVVVAGYTGLPHRVLESRVVSQVQLWVLLDCQTGVIWLVLFRVLCSTTSVCDGVLLSHHSGEGEASVLCYPTSAVCDGFLCSTTSVVWGFCPLPLRCI